MFLVTLMFEFCIMLMFEFLIILIFLNLLMGLIEEFSQVFAYAKSNCYTVDF